MPREHEHKFGGNWTDEKLYRLKKYLSFYTKALKNQPFSIAYIDAFAGTGYRSLKRVKASSELMFPELVENETKRFIDGSARIAIQIEPEFDKYIFIEKDTKRFQELSMLNQEFPNVSKKIELVNADANSWLRDRCLNYSWKSHRAVLFLDPYGMEVQWETMIAIAQTEAIDLWLLFPLGVAVNRLLKSDGKMDKAIVGKLNSFFGEDSWMKEFYMEEPNAPLFDSNTTLKKKANLKAISRYFVRRLKSIFADASDNPLPLLNSKNNPLFLLCFAVGNKRAANLALKAANHILNN